MATRLFHETCRDGKRFEAEDVTTALRSGWVDDPARLTEVQAIQSPAGETVHALPSETPLIEPPAQKQVDIRDLSVAEVRDVLPRLRDLDVLQIIHNRELTADTGGRKTVLALISARMAALRKGLGA